MRFPCKKTAPRPPYTPLGSIESSRGLRPSRALRGFSTVWPVRKKRTGFCNSKRPQLKIPAAIYNPSPKVSKSRRCPARLAGRWEQSLHCQQKKILNRFPIQNRCDQARQQMSAGTARRFPIQNRRDQARQQAPAGTARHFLIQNRRDQARQQGLAGTARLDGEKGRWYTEIKNRRTLCGLILTTIHSR